LLRSTI